MRRYYFHLVGQNEKILDGEGVELAEEVIEHLQSILRDINSDEPGLFDLDGPWAIEVVTDTGDLVAFLQVRDVVLATRRSGDKT